MKKILTGLFSVCAFFSGVTWLFATEPLFEIQNQQLPRSVLTQLQQARPSQTKTQSAPPSALSAKENITFSFSNTDDIQETKIIFLNETSGKSVVIKPQSRKSFKLTPVLARELALNNLDAPDSFRFIVYTENGNAVDILDQQYVQSPDVSVTLPEFQYRAEDGTVQTASGKNRKLLRALTASPKLIFANPTDPVNIQTEKDYAEKNRYNIYLYELPNKIVCTFSDVQDNLSQTAKNNVSPSYYRVNGALPFDVNLNGTSPAGCENATTYATGIYGQALTGTVPVQMDIVWTAPPNIPDGALGGSRQPEHVLIDGIWYPSAIANQKLGFDNFRGQPDIDLIFNSIFTFYFGTDMQCGNNTDYPTVLLHEMTHGLGFFDTIGTDGAYVYGGPNIFDTLLASGTNGNRLTALNANARAAAIISNNLYYAGEQTVNANAGARIKLYAPTGYRPGSSVSHWDDTVTFTTFMKFQYHYAFHTLNERKIAALQDLGWETPNQNNPRISVNPTSLNIASGGGAATFTLGNIGRAPFDYTLNAPAWLTLSSTSGTLNPDQNHIITVSTAINTTGQNRSATITISSTTPDVVGSPQTVRVSQLATPTAPAPEFSRAAGNFSTPFNLEIKSTTSGVGIFYTLDGSVPTQNSTSYNAPIPITETTTVKAIAAKAGMLNSTVATAVYTFVPLALAERPVFSRTTQSFSIPFKLHLTSSDPGAKIYYTTDGSTPTIHASLYKDEIYIGNSLPAVTVKAFAVVEGKTNSPIVEETFTYSPNGKVETPVFDRAGGVFSSPFYLNISCPTNGATIAYTTDGTTPSAFSPIYNGGIKISRTVTVKTIAFFPGMTNSEITSVTFTQSTQLPVSAPVFSQTASIVRTPVELRLSSPTEGAQIYYTFSDTTLPSCGMLYQKPLLVDRDMTIRAIAVKEGLENSPIVVQNYRYNPQFDLTAPVFVIPSRNFSSPFVLKIISPAVSAALYYGLHLPGTVCTEFKPYPREGIVISSDVQISAYAIQEGIRSETVSAIYYYKKPSPAALGSTLTLEAVDCPDLPRFEKPPVIKGSYQDFNGRLKPVKFKRVGLTTDRVMLELNSKVMLFNRSLLFRGYYAQGLSVLDFLADGNQDSKIVTLTVKSGVQTSNAAQGLVIAEPVIDSVNGKDFELNHPQLITRGGTLSIQGSYFGKKSPKAWIEYAKNNGKLAKVPVKVVKYTFSFNPENGKTVFTIQMPVKFPSQMEIPGVYTLVFDTGCGLAALNLNLR